MGDQWKDSKYVGKSVWIFRILKVLGAAAVLGATALVVLNWSTPLLLRTFLLVLILYLFGVGFLVLPRRAYSEASVRAVLGFCLVPILISDGILLNGHSSVRTSDLSPEVWASFLSGILIYFGAVVLAMSVLHQNKKVQESNENYQKISALPYISFMTSTYISCKPVPPEVFAFEKANFHGPQMIFRANREPVRYFVINITVRNNSGYPITQLSAKGSVCSKVITNYDDTLSVYIAEHQTESIRIVIPMDARDQDSWNDSDESFIKMDIYSTNALDFTTKGTVFVRYVNRTQTDVTYRVGKLGDMDPFMKEPK